MKILLVTHYFPPEVGAPQARLSDLARIWSDSGDSVTVLTGMPNHPTGIVHPEYRGAVRRRETVDGYRVVRTWIFATPNEGIIKKTLSHLSFMVSSVLLGTRATGPVDVVVVSSPTFFAIGSGWLLSRIKRARFVVEVRDLWPAIFVELGVLTNRWLIGLLELVELAAYRAADLVVVVSEGFRGILTDRGIPSEKVHTIRNGVSLDRFSGTLQSESSFRKRTGAKPLDTIVLYAGAHGISQGLHTMIDAAAGLQNEPIHFVLVGEGAEKQRLVDRTAKLGLKNASLLPSVSSDEMPDLLAMADICIVSLRDVPLFTTFIPSKIFEYLAADRAVIGAVSGEAATILREAGGIVVPPEDDEKLREAIRIIAADADRRRDMASRGRQYVQENFDRSGQARRYRELLDALEPAQ